MTTHRQHPRNSPRAFTLIELLIVIAIIGLLAGLIAYLLPGVTEKKVRGRITTDMRGLETVINRYKEKNGFYPPDNAQRTDGSLLYYELTGTEPTTAVSNLFGGIVSSGESRRNFYENLKPNGYVLDPAVPEMTNLVVAYKGPNGEPNFWHYKSNNPQHNTEGFDLWAVVVIGNKQITIGNWKD